VCFGIRFGGTKVRGEKMKGARLKEKGARRKVRGERREVNGGSDQVPAVCETEIAASLRSSQ
jgi:hypothetical protein